MALCQDDICRWPSPAEVFALNDILDGHVILPGVDEYDNATIVGNLVFQSAYGAVVFPESVGKEYQLEYI